LAHEAARAHHRRLVGFALGAAIALAACGGSTKGGTSGSSSTPSPGTTATAASSNGQIVYGRYDDAVSDFHHFIAEADGSHERQLLPQVAECPRWSADGQTLLVCMPNPMGLLRAATIHADGSGLTLLDNPDPTLNLPCGAWSPDGTRLLCEGWDDTNPDRFGIYSVRASDGGDLQRITTNPMAAHDVPGSYSPDGTAIAFVREQPGTRETAAIFTVHPDGTSLVQITPYGVPGCCNAHWSPDGTKILFASEDGALFTIRPDGQGQTPIHLDIAEGFSYGYAPSWSPDGQSIIFSLTRVPHGKADLYTARADGTHVVQVTNTPEEEDLAAWGTRH
jgi:Tol biopolymer transport system component